MTTLDTRTSRERSSVRRSPSVRTVHGSPGLLLGLAALLAMGGLALLIGMFRFSAGGGDLEQTAGVLFLVGAAVFAWNGLAGGARAGIGGTRAWRADGFTSRVLTDGVGHPHGRLALQALLCLGVGGYFVRRSAAGEAEWLLGVAFLVVCAGTLAYMLWNQLHRWKFGRRTLVVRKLPTRPGEDIELIFRGGSRLRDTGIGLRLQCVEQEHRVRHSDRHGGQNTVTSYRIYQEERSDRTDPRGDLSLTFAIPADLPGTRLRVGSAETAIYWRLQLSCAVPGLDYEGEFLLPVYEG